MMGVQEQPQSSLFHFGIHLDKRIRSNHPLRKVNVLVDFAFAYDEVKSFYGHNGNESVPPPVILKLMLLLVFYNVRSERELMETLPERMDWLWFLGYDLDSTIPEPMGSGLTFKHLLGWIQIASWISPGIVDSLKSCYKRSRRDCHGIEEEVVHPRV